MAITTYGGLQAAVAAWLVRTDLGARIPEFITLAEARLNRVLRHRLALADQALTLPPGARRLALPTDFAEAAGLWLEGETRRALPFVEPGLMQTANAAGPPRAWGVDGADLAFDRPADRSYGLGLRYRRAYVLSEAAPSNALLAEAPDIYLFAALCEAAPLLRDAELTAAYEARLDRAIAELNSRDGRNRRLQSLATDLPTPWADGAFPEP